MASGSYPNLAFYENKRGAEPNDEHIEVILTEWRGNYELLEKNHTYIQWLFPTEDPGLNSYAFPLRPEEAEKIQNNSTLKDRVKRAFEMMLDFYGMRLTGHDKFVYSQNSEERLKALNTKENHNFQRITRILKSLKELGFTQLMLPWLKFLVELIFNSKDLDQAEYSFCEYWLDTLEAADKQNLERYLKELLESWPLNKQAYSIIGVTAQVPDHKDDTNSKTSETTMKEQKSEMEEEKFYDPPNDTNSNTSQTSMNEQNNGMEEGISNDPPTWTPNFFPNLAFYENQRGAEPNAETIEVILKEWKGDYEILDINHTYIQWLFPTHEDPGLNIHAFPLRPEEAEKIRETTILKERVKRALDMMLDFYGMRLTGQDKFVYSQNSGERLKLLNSKDYPNFQRITRILKSLKELGFDQLMLPWMKFLTNLVYKTKELDQAEYSFTVFWLETLNAKDKEKMVAFLKEMLESWPYNKHAYTTSGITSSQPDAAGGEHDHRRHKPELERENAMSCNLRNPAGDSKIIAFYCDELRLEPNGETISDILNWKGDYEKLMTNTYYIDWMFPTFEPGVSVTECILTEADAEIIRETPKLDRRVILAFEMVLDFYGMKLDRDNRFHMTDVERLKKLNEKDNPHWVHIKRILQSLKNLGYKNLMIPFMKFLADLIYDCKYIENAEPTFRYWMQSLDGKEFGKVSDYSHSKEQW